MFWSFFLAIFVALSGGSHLYVWLKLRAALVPAKWRVVFIILGILGNAAIFCGRGLRGMLPESMACLPEIISAVGFTWFVFIAITFASLVFAEVIGLVMLVIKIKISQRGILCLGVMLGLAILMWGLGEAYFVRRRDVEITSAKLPAGLDHIRIAQLSDVHLGGLYTRSHLERALAIVREAQPDLIFMTGDLVDGDMQSRGREREMLSEVTKAAPLGAFAVNGNHEYYTRMMYGADMDLDAFIASCGFTLLTDECADIPEANILIVGFDDRASDRIDRIGDLEQRDVDGKFVIILKHRPALPSDAENKFDLQLSGHTHGGQFWPFGFLSSRANGNSVQGLVPRAGGLVYTSNGTGFWGPPLRIGVPPEVTVIDLVRASHASDAGTGE